jgi:hypothetical protein
MSRLLLIETTLAGQEALRIDVGQSTRAGKTMPPLFQAMIAMAWEKRLATPTGFEPVTNSLEGYCSIQLSYGAVTRRLAQIAALVSL